MAHCQAKSTLSCQCNIIKFNEVEFDSFKGGSLTIPHSMVTVVQCANVGNNFLQGITHKKILDRDNHV